MKIFKRGAKFGKDEQPLGEFIFWRSMIGVGAALSGAGQFGRLALIGASWIPLPPLQWIGLSAAVWQGRLKSVQRLAKPSVFKTMPRAINNEIVRKAGDQAKDSTTLERKEIFNVLLCNGAVVTQQSFHANWLFTIFSLKNLIEATQNDTVHDDTKYEMFMYCIKSNSKLLQQLTEPMMVQWSGFFTKLQDNPNDQLKLWNSVLNHGSSALVEKLVECTPVTHLTPQRLYCVFDRQGLTPATFDALIAKGLDIEDMLLASAQSKPQCIDLSTNALAPNTPKVNQMIQHKWLERNPVLKEVVEHARNIKQKQRLITSVAQEETPKPTHEDHITPTLQRKRKM